MTKIKNQKKNSENNQNDRKKRNQGDRYDDNSSDDLYDVVEDLLIQSRKPLTFFEIDQRTNINKPSTYRQLKLGLKRGAIVKEEVEVFDHLVSFYYKNKDYEEDDEKEQSEKD